MALPIPSFVPTITPKTPVFGLLVSQVGYDSTGPQRAILRAPFGTSLAEPGYDIFDTNGISVSKGSFKHWGAIWNSEWWIGDFAGLPTGNYSICALGVPALERVRERFEIGDDLLFQSTWKQVSIEQMEACALFGRNDIGWQDCGALLQEANSHASCVIGLCELLDIRSSEMSPEERRRLQKQIVTGCDYLVKCQEQCEEKGLGEGALIHEVVLHPELVLTGDVSKAVIAWSMSTRLLDPELDADRKRFHKAAVRAMAWLVKATPPGKKGWLACVHGVPQDYVPPTEWMTNELVINAWAALELSKIGECVYQENAFADLRRIAARQITEGESSLYGHFRLFDTGDLLELTWSHHLPKGEVGSDTGATYPNYLLPFIMALRMHPDHPDAELWRTTLKRFTYGYLIPICKATPFGIVPLGIFPNEGPLWFAGAWHGFNCSYALTAALALELKTLFPEPALDEIAHSNLLWIAGLNAGITAESLAGCVIWKRDIPEGRALPVSMINGIGARWAGTWFNVRGAICNGFSNGEQFVWDVPPKKEFDAPFTFTDENWITHGGAWLSAVSRLR